MRRGGCDNDQVKDKRRMSGRRAKDDLQIKVPWSALEAETPSDFIFCEKKVIHQRYYMNKTPP